MLKKIVLVCAFWLFGAMSVHAGCQVGTTVMADKAFKENFFRIDILAALEDAKVLDIMDGKEAVGDAAVEIYRQMKQGKIPRFSGVQSQLVVHIDGVGADFPSRIDFLLGDDVCQGSVPVRTIAPGRVEVYIPIRAGSDLGQAGLVLPRGPLRSKSVLVCIQADRPVYVPKLDFGRYKGVENMLCGLPGDKSGWTRFGKLVDDKTKWYALYPLVFMR